MKVEPSLLLHPLDFMGADDNVGLEFFPAMDMQSEEKLNLAGDVIDYFCSMFQVGTMRDHAFRKGGLITKKKNTAGRSVASKRGGRNAPFVGVGTSIAEE